MSRLAAELVARARQVLATHVRHSLTRPRCLARGDTAAEAGTNESRWGPRASNGDQNVVNRGGDRRVTAVLEGVRPVSRKFGFDRGQPIDRHYIEQFLSNYARDIAGRVLEVGDNTYTRRFGGARVVASEVLNPTETPGTTLVADLAAPDTLPERRFDCLILTQVLPFIFDVPAVVRSSHRLLKPGGVLLATVPGISQISRYDMERWGDFWRFTPASLRRLLSREFRDDLIELHTYGNVRAASAFLYGLARQELTTQELDYVDEDYPVIIAARAVRPG